MAPRILNLGNVCLCIIILPTVSNSRANCAVVQMEETRLRVF
jgi:hypothetical protein